MPSLVNQTTALHHQHWYGVSGEPAYILAYSVFQDGCHEEKGEA